MVFLHKRIVVFTVIALISPALFNLPAAADELAKKVSAMLSMLSDVFRQVDPEAAAALAAKRDELPANITRESDRIQPILAKEVMEIQANIQDRFERTGDQGIPLWPQTKEMLDMLRPLVTATYNLSFQSKVSETYTPYLSLLEKLLKAATPPTDAPADAPPFEPPVDQLNAAVAYFTVEAVRIRQGSQGLDKLNVAGASSAADLEKNLVAAQSKINALKEIHPIVDAAVEGLSNGLAHLIKVAQQMGERYDYYSPELVDGIIEIANEHLDTNATEQLDQHAEFVEFIAGELTAALAYIKESEGGKSTEGAVQVLTELLPKVALKKADAEAAMAGLAAKVADLESKSDAYYLGDLRTKHRHCFHETIAASSMKGLYSMADEYRNLESPGVLLSRLNSELWDTLKDEILSVNAELSASVKDKVNAQASLAADKFKLPIVAGEEIPPLPQLRFSGECGVYVPDPGSSALVYVSASQAGVNIVQARAAIAKVSREIKRRKKLSQGTNCAPTNKKCIKKAQQAARLKKQLKKLKANVKKRAKKFVSEVPARLNKAYFGVYGEYPYIPYRD